MPAWWLLRLQWRRGESIPRLLREMAAWRGPSQPLAPDEAARRVSRLIRWARRIPGLWSSCIPRSLILARLLRGHPGLVLKIGFPERPGGAGHAWVCIGDEPVLGEDRALLSSEPHVETKILTLGGESSQ